MRLAQLTTASGYSWKTEINGSDDDLCQYFLGTWFDCGNGDEESMQQVVKIEIDGVPFELTAK